MKTRRKSPPHVKVTWIDAAGPETLEQYNLETAKTLDLELAEDSGWILTVDDIRIVLGSEKFDDGEYRRTVIIPRVNIVEVCNLEEGSRTLKYHSKLQMRMTKEAKKKVMARAKEAKPKLVAKK